MKITKVSIDQAKTVKGKNKEQVVDYSKLPKFSEAEWYNMQVFGQKTAPKAK